MKKKHNDVNDKKDTFIKESRKRKSETNETNEKKINEATNQKEMLHYGRKLELQIQEINAGLITKRDNNIKEKIK